MRKSETTNPVVKDDEKVYEQSLRPVKIKDFAGQTKITDNAVHRVYR